MTGYDDVNIIVKDPLISTASVYPSTEVIDDYNVYNDLQELLSERDEMEVSRNEDAAPAAYVDTERHPKPKSFYKAKKEREKKKG